MASLTPMQSCDYWIIPDWPAPARVRALTTTRLGGVSLPPFDTLNLARHVGDKAASVNANRNWLINMLGLPEHPRWLHQVHGTHIVAAATVTSPAAADGSYTRDAGIICAVLTADCLPVLLCDKSGTAVAVVHAGWRGLAAGVVEAVMEALQPTAPDQLMAWLGPAIGPTAFVVGDEVRAEFVDRDAAAAAAFEAAGPGCWRADLYYLARRHLDHCGVTGIYGGGFCTYTDHTRFFSYRRDRITGRTATLIWLQS